VDSARFLYVRDEDAEREEGREKKKRNGLPIRLSLSWMPGPPVWWCIRRRREGGEEEGGKEKAAFFSKAQPTT